MIIEAYVFKPALLVNINIELLTLLSPYLIMRFVSSSESLHLLMVSLQNSVI